MKILITGGNGFIASNIVENFNQHELFSIRRQDFDLCDPEATKVFFKDKKVFFLLRREQTVKH